MLPYLKFIMLDAYFRALEEFSPLDATAKKLLEEFIVVTKVVKSDYILEQGAVCNYIYFLDQGFARQFYYKNGKEITEWFAAEKEFCFSIESYFHHTPSKLTIQALEDSVVIGLHRDALMELSKKHSQISQLALNMLSTSLVYSQQRMETILFESAKDRYRHLLETKPKIIQKVPLAHIASFLGITQETLSRIRAKL